MNNVGIYVIKNILNGKYYVGSANKITTRKSRHISDLKLNRHHSIKLQRSWNKNGCDAFIFEVIQYCNTEDLIINEQYWIDHFDSYNNGYNCNPIAGSQKGRVWTKEQKEKARASKIGTNVGVANPFFGKKHSEEVRKRMSENKKAANLRRKLGLQ